MKATKNSNNKSSTSSSHSSSASINASINVSSKQTEVAEPAVAVTSSSEPFLRIAACSYEGSLFGWHVTEDIANNSSSSGNNAASLDLEMKFGFNVCQSSLRSVTVSGTGRYLACAGMDERIRLFDVEENRAMGEMSNHSGVINCLQFFGDTYLFSGSEVRIPVFY
jgi:WD40 repeat protein